MSAVEFGDGREPWSVARGKVKRWLHALVRDASALPGPWRDDLTAWLADRGVTSRVVSVLVTRGDDGHRVHIPGTSLDVELADLPAWLQAETPEPEAVKPKKARRVADD